MSNLKHVNIVRLIDHNSDIEKGLFEIRMEYCSCDTLHKNDLYRNYEPGKRALL